MDMTINGGESMTVTHVALVSGTALVVTILLNTLFWIVRGRSKAMASKNIDNLKQTVNDEKLTSSIILNAIEDAVVLIDESETVRVLNPAAARLTGWPAKESMNINYDSIFHLIDGHGNKYPEDQDPFNEAFTTAATVRDSKATLVSRDKHNTSVSLIVSPLLGSNKQVRGVIGILRDVSEERREEQQRAEFISTASHEMRTPVAAIEGYLALALNAKVSSIDLNARGYLEKAHMSTRHLGQLFQDLLTSAKVEDGRLSSYPTAIEMGEFTRHLCEDLKFAADKKGLAVELILSNNPGDANENIGSSKVIHPLYYVFADPDRLREVTTNLFDNAVKYTDHGKITLGLTGDEDIVQLRVSDTGGGIASADIPHLFQKFYRVDNSATRTVGGTGLGLFICRKIVELYNGRTWVDSVVGQGSNFYINLPRLSGQKAAEIQAQAPPQATAVISPATTSIPVATATAPAPTTRQENRSMIQFR